MQFSNLKIGHKLAAAFGFLVLVTAVVGAFTVNQLREIEAARASVDSVNSGLANLRDAKLSLAGQENEFRGYLVSRDANFLELLATERGIFVKRLAEAEQSFSSDATAGSKIGATRTAAAEWYELVDGASKTLIAGGDQATADALVGNNGPSDRAIEPAYIAIGALLDSASARRTALSLDLADSTKTATLYLTVGAIVSALAAVLIGWLLSQAIARPLSSLTKVAEGLAAGTLTVEVSGLNRKDEIGAMSRSVQVFKEQAVALQATTLAANAAEATAKAEREARALADAAAAHEQSEIVSETATAMSALAAGDLAHRITMNFPGQYARLQSDFNAAMDKLEEAMGVIGANASAIQSGAGEISQAADDLSRRTEQQAATLEETAAALDEITATVKRTAEGAERAGTVVVGAKAAAEQSGVVVGRAVAAMGEIERSSDEISQIIGVIDEIAFQTNLLALNAGVEAARAGDAGRGFAVVASEVRALAQRSAEAAKEIKSLIAASSGHVKDGVGLVGETGQALTAIVERVSEINGLMAEITASALEQATALSEVNTAVNQMDQTTQQNAAMVEESTAASHNLSQEAAELASLVGKFHVSDSGRSAPSAARTKPNPVRQAQSRIAEFARQPTAAPVRRVAAGGGAAALAQSAEPQWEQF